jgi:ubiquinone biosynthesis protein
MTEMSMYFAQRHGDRITAEVGIDPRTVEVDLTGVKASFGLDAETSSLTHRDLQARRAMMRDNLAASRKRRGRS